MFGSDILEVAIGMVFLYLFMSMIASALREAFEAFLQHRAVFLERGLSEMLRDGDDRTWVAKFYNHPMISSLYKGNYGNCGKLPAYIPKESFSLALLDLAAEASEAGKVLSIPDLKAKLQVKDPAPNAVQRVVLTALSAAGDDLAGVRKQLEDWYDATMQRVTGWYARRSAAFLFAIGLGAAVSLNVDSIFIAKSLIVDRPLRQAIVAQAEKAVQQTAPAGNQDGANPSAAGDAQKKSFDDLRNEFAEIGYPIGWTTSDDGHWYPAPQACKPKPGGIGFTCDLSGAAYWGTMLLAVMGWLITAIAVMLGAPFWFDLLNKLISLRSALKPPKTKAEAAARPAAGDQAADQGA